MRERIITKVPIRAVTKGPKHHFFGYYDKCPWDATGRYLLAMEVDFQDRLPGPDDVAIIGVVDLENGCRFEPIAETRAWNFQQGAMAQWMPPNFERYIIYNDREKDRVIAIIHDIETGQKVKCPMPVYAVSPDGRYALGINFARLHRLRPGYGYAGLNDPWADEPAPKKDGIYLLNIPKGSVEKNFSIAEIAHFQTPKGVVQGNHWIEHLSFSPDGKRFAFFHRFSLPGGGIYTRLLTSDLKGKKIYLLSEGMVSHYTWRNSYQILAWARIPRRINRLQAIRWLQPLFGWVRHLTRAHPSGWVRQNIIGDAYILFTDCSKEFKIIGKGVLTTDGHCSFSPSGDWLLTDTYPDNLGYRHLLVYHMSTGKCQEIARFYSPSELSGPIRCDLHPRWNRTGTAICVDSAHTGQRQIYILTVEHIINQ